MRCSSAAASRARSAAPRDHAGPIFGVDQVLGHGRGRALDGRLRRDRRLPCRRCHAGLELFATAQDPVPGQHSGLGQRPMSGVVLIGQRDRGIGDASVVREELGVIGADQDGVEHAEVAIPAGIEQQLECVPGMGAIRNSRTRRPGRPAARRGRRGTRPPGAGRPVPAGRSAWPGPAGDAVHACPSPPDCRQGESREAPGTAEMSPAAPEIRTGRTGSRAIIGQLSAAATGRRGRPRSNVDNRTGCGRPAGFAAPNSAQSVQRYRRRFTRPLTTGTPSAANSFDCRSMSAGAGEPSALTTRCHGVSSSDELRQHAAGETRRG